jgi:hypothetical protein
MEGHDGTGEKVLAMERTSILGRALLPSTSAAGVFYEPLPPHNLTFGEGREPDTQLGIEKEWIGSQ